MIGKLSGWFCIIIFAIIIAAACSGCGKTDQLVAHYTGYSKICVDGVKYLQFTSGASPQYTVDGKLVACK